WDPFNITERRMEAAERRAEAAVDEARARRLEAEGAADQAGRLDHHHRKSVALVRATAAADAQARNADDAQVPLDPARAARLRAHDGQPCGLAPELCGAPAPDPAAGSRDAVPPGPPAAGSDPGRS